jgi:hypothetical protein
MGSSGLSNMHIMDIGATVIKGFVFLMMVLYLIYTFLFSRKLKIMNQNLETPYRKFFYTVSWFHMLSILIVVILTALYLR